MKRSFKVTLMVTLLGATMLTSACSPVKPPHKQTFEKFSERRAPRDNLAMANGTLDPNAEKKSGFVPYTGVININNPTTQVDTKSKTGGVVIEQNSAGSQSTNNQNNQQNNQQQKSLLERLLGKLDFGNEHEVVQVADNSAKRSPKQNVVSGYGLGQGSSAGQNIYEIADEIIPAQPVTKIESKPIEPVTEKAMMLVAQTKPVNQGVYNPSAPLVEVPEIPSKEEMKQKGEKVEGAPHLKDIPQTPDKFKAPEPKPEPKMEPKKEELVVPNEIKKEEPKALEPKPHMMPKKDIEKKHPSHDMSQVNKKSVTAYDFNMGQKKHDFKINDPKAKIMRSHGAEVVSGELGEFKRN